MTTFFSDGIWLAASGGGAGEELVLLPGRKRAAFVSVRAKEEGLLP